jgi:hypothetical protein
VPVAASLIRRDLAGLGIARSPEQRTHPALARSWGGLCGVGHPGFVPLVRSVGGSAILCVGWPAFPSVRDGDLGYM